MNTKIVEILKQAAQPGPKGYISLPVDEVVKWQLSALSQAGYVIVPREPTEEMNLTPLQTVEWRLRITAFENQDGE